MPGSPKNRSRLIASCRLQPHKARAAHSPRYSGSVRDPLAVLEGFILYIGSPSCVFFSCFALVTLFSPSDLFLQIIDIIVRLCITDSTSPSPFTACRVHVYKPALLSKEVTCNPHAILRAFLPTSLACP